MATSPLVGGFDDGAVAVDLVPIAPSATTDLPTTARAVRCTGAGGTLRITTISGNVRNTVIAANEVLYVAVTRVHDTGTSATGLEAML